VLRETIAEALDAKRPTRSYDRAMKRIWMLALLVGLGCLLWLDLRPPGSTLYTGGPIVTLDGEGSVASALLVSGDRIVGVGSEAELSKQAGPNARRVDLAGHALLPGFIDAHGHFPGEGVFAVMVDLNSPPIGTIRTMSELVERLGERAAEKSAGDWVIGMGYDDTLLSEGRHPTREDLDRASSEHPILISHSSGHLVVLNSLGLELAGIDAETPDPEGGVIRRAAGSGEPDGVLEESAMELLEEVVPTPGLMDGIRIVREASRRYVAAGVTTAQSGYTAKPLMQLLPLMVRTGLAQVRLVLWPGMEVVDERLDDGGGWESYDERWVRGGAVKLIADGSIQGYTGYLTEPYFVPPGDEPDYVGYPRILRDELIERVTRYHAAGYQVAVHGNGDAAIDDILEAFEIAQSEHPREDTRHVVIHAQMARDDQLERMKALGVIPSFFSLHTYYWGDRHREIFMGPGRAARMSPAGSAVRMGLRFTIHADSPVVPMEPLRLVWAAVNRVSSSGHSMGEAQRVSVLQALRAVTIDAAYQHFEEADKGSLEPGKLADLVILSESPLERPERIDEIRVLETIIGGRTVFLAGD
jgi:predicted amidohydrolase YtcJ